MPVNAVSNANTVNDVLQASMAYQRLRIEAAAKNIARANVALSPGERTPAVQGAANFASELGLPPANNAAAAGNSNANAPAYRLAIEPGHPAADEHGVVRYPDVDLATEMTTMMSASRAYEASVRAYNLLKSMNAKAMEIGK